MCTKFCQNRLGFIEDMTKTFWCFLVHSVAYNDMTWRRVTYVMTMDREFSDITARGVEFELESFF